MELHSLLFRVCYVITHTLTERGVMMMFIAIFARDESSKGRLRSAHFIQRYPRQGTTSLTLLITFRLRLHRRAHRAEPQDSTMSHKRYHATLNPFGNPHARGRAFTVYGTA